MNKVILVDDEDNVIGNADKMLAHELGLLHRAFSVFIMNDNNELLLQKRAKNKYHSAGLWSNTCCSHPENTTSIKELAKIRLEQEMGIEAKLNFKFKIKYNVDVSNNLIENEFDYVFFGNYNKDPIINPKEVEDYRWMKLDELMQDISRNNEKYTPWFLVIMTHMYGK